MSPEAIAALPSRTRVIVAAGSSRSGSTPLYNIARLLLEREGPLTAGWVEDILEPVQCVLVVKVHEWHPGLARRADVVLTCHRDLRNVARSLAAMGWLWGHNKPGATAFDHLGKIVRLHRQWSDVAAVDLRYEEMVDDWTTATSEIAAALGLLPASTEVAAVAREVAEMRQPGEESERGYDPKTLMHPNHRASRRAGSPLPEELAHNIHQRFYEWQATHGYGDLSTPEISAVRRALRSGAG